LLQLGVAVAISENQMTMKFAASIDTSFLKRLLCCVQAADSIFPELPSKLKFYLSDPATALSTRFV
jgi:hypothetical protein